VFSQNNTIGPYIEGKGYRKGPTYIGANLTTTIGGGVCKISSTLYNVSVLSNLEIVERYNHTMPVPYVPYGQDATVAYGVKDFKFKNNTDFPILIWAKGIENRLYMGVYGKEEPPEVEWNHNIQNIIKTIQN
jgi:vancomycin resistance protein YoaR